MNRALLLNTKYIRKVDGISEKKIFLIDKKVTY